MGAFIVYARSEVLAGAPSYAQIVTLFRGIPLITQRSPTTPDHGNFVGSPRVVRTARLLPSGQGGGRITEAAWLYMVPDVATDTPAQAANRVAAIRQVVLDQLAPALAAADQGWGTPQAMAYDPAVNGSIEWWQSGQAAQTATANAFDLNQQFGQNESVDSVLGPTPAATRPPNLGHDLNPSSPDSPIGKFVTLAEIGLVVAGVFGLIYLFGPAVRGASERAGAALKPRRQVMARARANPRRRRHAR